MRKHSKFLKIPSFCCIDSTNGVEVAVGVTGPSSQWSRNGRLNVHKIVLFSQLIQAIGNFPLPPLSVSCQFVLQYCRSSKQSYEMHTLEQLKLRGIVTFHGW